MSHQPRLLMLFAFHRLCLSVQQAGRQDEEHDSMLVYSKECQLIDHSASSPEPVGTLDDQA